MKALTCDFCGGQLVMDPSREFATCEFCGTKYMKETVQQKVQEIRGEVKVVGAVEIVKGEAEKERLLNNAETYEKIQEYDKAIEAFNQITKEYPDDYKGWWGIVRAQIERYLVSGLFDTLDSNALRNSVKLGAPSTEMRRFFDSFLDAYGTTIRLNPAEIGSYIAFSKLEDQIYTIDSMTKWLIYDGASGLEVFPENFQEFLQDITNQYVDGVRKGRIIPYYSLSIPPLSKVNISVNLSNLPKNTIRNFLIQRINVNYKVVPPSPQHPTGFTKYYRKNIMIDVEEIIAISGKWILAKTIDGNTINILSQTLRELTQESIFTDLGRCQYCGGVFSGTFKKYCTVCGKQKNY